MAEAETIPKVMRGLSRDEYSAFNKRVAIKGRFKRRRKAEGLDCCEACGWRAPRVRHNDSEPLLVRMLEVHHIVPTSKGGGDEDENLMLLCPNCHAVADAINWLWQPSSSSPFSATRALIIEAIRLAYAQPEIWIELWDRTHGAADVASLVAGSVPLIGNYREQK